MMFNLFNLFNLFKKPDARSKLKPAPRCFRVDVYLNGRPTPITYEAPDSKTTLMFSVVDDTLWVRVCHDDYRGTPALAMHMTSTVGYVTAEYKDSQE